MCVNSVYVLFMYKNNLNYQPSFSPYAPCRCCSGLSLDDNLNLKGNQTLSKLWYYKKHNLAWRRTDHHTLTTCLFVLFCYAELLDRFWMNSFGFVVLLFCSPFGFFCTLQKGRAQLIHVFFYMILVCLCCSSYENITFIFSLRMKNIVVLIALL